MYMLCCVAPSTSATAEPPCSRPPCPAGDALSLVGEAVSDDALRQCRPSLLAAAVLAAARQRAGVSPPWPQALLVLTGISDAEGGELEVATHAAASLAAAPAVDADGGAL